MNAGNNYTIKRYYTHLSTILFLSNALKILILASERIFCFSCYFGDYFGLHFIFFDLFFWTFFLIRIKIMLSQHGMIFDFIESSLIVLVILTNFYLSIVSASLYFRVFGTEESIEKVFLTMLTFANGNAAYTNVFDENMVFFSIISVLSYLILVLVIGIVVAALSSEKGSSAAPKE